MILKILDKLESYFFQKLLRLGRSVFIDVRLYRLVASQSSKASKACRTRADRSHSLLLVLLFHTLKKSGVIKFVSSLKLCFLHFSPLLSSKTSTICKGMVVKVFYSTLFHFQKLPGLAKLRQVEFLVEKYQTSPIFVFKNFNGL